MNDLNQYYPQRQKNDDEDEDQTKNKKNNANGTEKFLNILGYDKTGNRSVAVIGTPRIPPEILEILSTAAKHGSTIMMWVSLFANWYFTREEIVNYVEMEEKIKEEGNSESEEEEEEEEEEDDEEEEEEEDEEEDEAGGGRKQEAGGKRKMEEKGGGGGGGGGG